MASLSVRRTHLCYAAIAASASYAIFVGSSQGIFSIDVDQFSSGSTREAGFQLLPREKVFPTLLRSEVLGPSKGELPLSSEFRVSNTSEVSTNIVLDHLSCGCISVNCNDQVLDRNASLECPPGSSLTFSMIHGRPSMHPGVYAYSATFVVQDCVRRRMGKLSFRATQEIVADMSCLPEGVVWELKKGRSTEIREVTILRRYREKNGESGDDLRVESRPPCVVEVGCVRTVTAREIEGGLFEDTWDVKLQLEASESVPYDRLGGDVVFSLSGVEERSRVTVPVVARCVSPIQCPKLVSFGVLRIGHQAKRKVLLRSSDNRPFSIRSVKADGEEFSIALNGHDPQCQHLLDATFSPSAAGKCNGILRIATDHPQMCELYIDCAGVCSPDP